MHAYYVVQDNQVVGRYGNDLQGALRHLRLFGSSTMKSIPNRALIPILNNKSQHPHSILSVQHDGEEEDTKNDELKVDLLCCSWENDQVLEEMRMLAEKEHLMMFDRHSHYNLDAIPFVGYREDIREVCIQHFRRVSDRLKMRKDRLMSTAVVAVEKDDDDDDESQTSRPEATRTSVVIENTDELEMNK